MKANKMKTVINDLTGEICENGMYQCKCYHSLDFASAMKRVEPNKVDDYRVQLEDYENINDLINRSLLCKQRFVPHQDPNAVYETDDQIAQQLNIENNLLGEHETKDNKSSESSKQSEEQTELDLSQVEVTPNTIS